MLEFWGFLSSPAFTCFHSHYYISWQLYHSQSRNELDFTACFLHSLINCKIHYWETQSKSRPYITTRGPREQVTGAGNWSCSLHGRTLPRDQQNGPSPCFYTRAQEKGNKLIRTLRISVLKLTEGKRLQETCCLFSLPLYFCDSLFPTRTLKSISLLCLISSMSFQHVWLFTERLGRF